VIPGSVSDSAISKYKKDESGKTGSEENAKTSLSDDKAKQNTSENSVQKGSKGQLIEAEGAGPIQSMRFEDNGEPFTVTVGQSLRPKLIITPSDASTDGLTWKFISMGSGNASVDKDGNVTGIQKGEGLILTVTAPNGVTARCTINVKAPIPETISLYLNNRIELFVGETKSIVPTITPRGVESDDQVAEWTIGSSSIAVLKYSTNRTNEVTGKSPGTTWINAYLKNYPKVTARCEVVVKQRIPATQITLTPQKNKIYIGETIGYNVTILPTNANDKELTWSWTPSGSTVASVYTSSQQVTGRAQGTITIMASLKSNPNVKGSCTIEVIPVPVEGIEVSPTEITVAEGQTVTGPRATISPANATNRSVKWSVKDNSIATVSPTTTSSGTYVNVTGVKAGVTTLVAKADGGDYTKECRVIVTPPVAVTGIKLTPDPVTLTVNGTTKSVYATVEPANATNKNVIWDIEDSTVASIVSRSNTACSVRGLKKGRTRLIAKSAANEEIVAYSEIIVTPVEMTVTLDKTAITLETGTVSTLKATVNPSTVKYKDIKWSVDEGTIAEVSGNGLSCTITGLKSGTANVTVTVTEDEEVDPQVVSAVCKVTVKKSVSGLEIDPESKTIKVGEKFNITWKVLPEDADNKKVSLSNNNPGVISVTADGAVTGLSVGEAQIVVTTQDGDYSKTCNVTVEWTPVQGVILNTDEITLYEGEKRQLKARVYPEEADDKSVSWNSADTGTATVDDNGEVTGIKEGTTVVTVRTNDGGKEDHCTVHVIKKGIPVESITVTPSENTISIGEEFTAEAIVLPEDATDKSISWGSNNPSVATVSGDGLSALIKGISEGVAVITATTAGGKSAICVVTVKKDWISVTDVVLNTDEITLYEGEKQQLKEHVYPEDASDKSVSWNSADPLIATVDENGEVTGVREGTTTVTVRTTDGGKEATCIVHVLKEEIPVESIIVTPSENSIVIGQDFNATAVIKPDNATNKKVTWKSNNPSVATVSANGLNANIKGNAKGVAVITATAAGGRTGICVVTVSSMHVPVEDIVLMPMFKEIYEGQWFDIDAEIYPENADDKTVTWSSSNEKVATVDERGRVTGIKKGEAVITAVTNDGGHTAECKVTVKENPAPEPAVYNLYIVDTRSSAYRKDLVRGMVERLEGDRYLIIRDSNGAVIKPLINGDSTLKYDKALFYDMWITDVGGYAKNDFGKCTVRIPLPNDMDVRKGTVTVVTLMDNRLDKSVASATGVMDGVNYVTFTTTHFTEYAILYKKNEDSKGSTQIIYRDVPVVQYRTETRTVYQNAPAQTVPVAVPQVIPRILDNVPKTGEAEGSLQIPEILHYKQTDSEPFTGRFMRNIEEFYGNIR
nr:Ig-like domain-containing protein [Lachnospiraceae bacterium]